MISIPNNDLKSSDIIDMSKLNFNIENKKLASLIYIRNCGIKNKLDFSNCSYEDKEEFLLLYINKEIEIKAKEFADTWVSILMNESGGESFLNDDEINTFIKNNHDKIEMVFRFINSLSAYKILQMNTFFDEKINTDKMKITDYDELSVVNITTILKYHDDLFNIIHNPNEVYYFKKLFNNYLIDSVINEHSTFNEVFSFFFNLFFKTEELYEDINKEATE